MASKFSEDYKKFMEARPEADAVRRQMYAAPDEYEENERQRAALRTRLNNYYASNDRQPERRYQRDELDEDITFRDRLRNYFAAMRQAGGEAPNDAAQRYQVNSTSKLSNWADRRAAQMPKAEDWFAERNAKYGNITLRPDFAQNIEGWDTQTGYAGGVKDNTPEAEAYYNYMYLPEEERDPEIERRLREDYERAGRAIVDDARPLTDEQKQIYQYLLNTEGEAAAKDYYDYISYDINAQQMEQMRQRTDAQTDTVGGKILSTAASIPANLVGGIAGTANIVGQNVRNWFGDYRPVDYNSGAQRISNYAQAAREGTQEDMGGVGRFLYGSTMSMVDSAVAQLVTRGHGGALLGLSAAQSAIQGAHERGANDAQALTVGILSGVFEMAMEQAGFDHLMDSLSNGMTDSVINFIRGAFSQAGAEGLEEGATTIANFFADLVIMGDKNQLTTMIRDYEAAGVETETARKAAGLKWFGQLLLDVLGGAFSGFFMGGVGQVANTYGTGRNIQAYGQAQDVLDFTNEYGTDASKALAQRAGSAENASAMQLGRMASVGGANAFNEDGSFNMMEAVRRRVAQLEAEKQTAQQAETQPVAPAETAQEAPMQAAEEVVEQATKPTQAVSEEDFRGMNPNYMKLVNETRRSAADTPAVQPIFNVDAARESIDDMQKRGGYYQPIGGSIEVEEDLADEVAGKLDSQTVRYSAKDTDVTAENWQRVLDGSYAIMEDSYQGSISRGVDVLFQAAAQKGGPAPQTVKTASAKMLRAMDIDRRASSIKRTPTEPLLWATRMQALSKVEWKGMPDQLRRQMMSFAAENSKVHLANMTAEQGRELSDILRQLNTAMRGEKRTTTQTVQRKAAPNVSYRTSSANNGTAQATTTKEKALSLSEIVERVRHDFGVNITIGHIRGAGVLGQYHNVNSGIRAKNYNDIMTIFHELGHHLNRKYGLVNGANKTQIDEMIRAAGSQNRAGMTRAQAAGEGVAEFMSFYLKNSETAAIDYPETTAYLREKLSKNDLALIDALAEEVNAYYVLGADNAQSAIVAYDSKAPDSRTLVEKLGDKASEAYQATVDSMHSIKLFSDRFGGDAYTLAINSAYADSVAASVLINGLTDINGKKVGGSLREALKGVNLKNKAEWNAFGEYLVVLHGQERLAEGMRVFADDQKNSTRWMENRQAELENQYPQFKAAGKTLCKFVREAYQAWGVETGLIPQDVFDSWVKRWGYYVPFQRRMDADQRRGARRSVANQDSTVRKARGSGRDIIHPVESIFANITKLVNAGMRNNVMQEIVSVAENAEDSALFLERVETPMTRQVDNIKPVKEGILDAATFSNFTNQDFMELVDILNNVDDTLIEYRKAIKSSDPQVVTVLRNGEQEFWRVNDPMLFESITSMAPARVGVLGDALAKVSRIMTSNLTGNNIVWSIFSNLPRDLQTAYVYNHEKNPVKLISNIGKAYVNKIRASLNSPKTDPLFLEYMAMGGGSESVYATDKKIASNVRSAIGGKKKAEYMNPLAWIEYVSNTIEAGPRFAEYVRMRNQGYSPQEAIFASHDVTVNFRRSGAVSKSVNKVVPFFNVGVQGTDKFFRFMSAQDMKPDARKKAIVARWSVLTGASLVLGALIFALNHGDEEKERDYAMLSTYTKNNFYCIPVGDGKYFTIPKARELSVLTSFFSAIMERYINQNPDAMKDFDEYAIDAFSPPIVDNVVTAIDKMFTEGFTPAFDELKGALGDTGMLGVLHYLDANKDFLGRPIVSSALEGLEPKDQFDAKTSKLAVLVGKALNVSPKRIDYFFQNVLGGFWEGQKSLFPMDKENRDWSLGVKSTYVRDSLFSTDITNIMYDNRDAADRAANSDPEDGAKAYWQKQTASMATFYSRFYGISKGSNNDQTRYARRSVLDMVQDFNRAYEIGDITPEQQAVFDYVNETGDTSVLPSVMPVTIKYGSGNNKNEVALTPTQYLEYQTNYLRLYWENTRGVGRSRDPQQYLKDAAADAKEDATRTALTQAGIPSHKQ